MDFSRLKGLLTGLLATGVIILVLLKFSNVKSPPPVPGTTPPSQSKPANPTLAKPPQPSDGNPSAPQTSPIPPSDSDMKRQQESEELKAQAIKNFPSRSEALRQLNLAFKPQLEAALRRDKEVLATQASAQVALREMAECLQRASDPAALQLPKEADSAIGDGGLKTLMQAACVRNADQIVRRYPALKAEFEANVLPKTPGAALDLARRKAREQN